MLYLTLNVTMFSYYFNTPNSIPSQQDTLVCFKYKTKCPEAVAVIFPYCFTVNISFYLA